MKIVDMDISFMNEINHIFNSYGYTSAAQTEFAYLMCDHFFDSFKEKHMDMHPVDFLNTESVDSVFFDVVGR